MDYLTLSLQGVVASYLELAELTKLNMLNLLAELDWKYIILYNYGDMINDKESKANFKTWREFYNYIDNLINSKATMLEFRSEQLSKLNLEAVKNTIPFNELNKFFYPNIAATLSSLEEGDVIKLKEEGDFLLVEKENASLVLKYKPHFSPHIFGMRNVRIHDFTPIYDYPIKYWDKEGFEIFNLFSLSLREDSEFYVESNIVYLIHNNIRYMLIFRDDTSFENFTVYKNPVRFKHTIYDKTNTLSHTTMFQAS